MNTSLPEAHHLLRVDGMSCAGCVRTVERTLNELPGVSSASVSFANQSAVVIGQLEIDAAIAAVNAAGYRAAPLDNTPIEAQEQAARQELLRSAVRSAAALLAGTLLMIDMSAGWLPGLDHRPIWTVIGLVSLAIMLLTGGHFYRGAWQAARNRLATMDTLILLGTGTAWAYSMLVILAPGLVPEGSRHQFFEAGLFIIGFVNFGKALESHARTRASLAIRRLFDLTPRFVHRLAEDGGDEALVPVEDVLPGQQLRLMPGEHVPVDGVIVSGSGSLDESMLTGESIPVLREPGDALKAGTINLDGSIIMQATEVGADTLLARMVHLVQEAQNTKPRLGHLVDRITAVFVPMVVLMAILTGAMWWWLGPEPRLSYTLVTTMSVLIIACPCALGLAIPMSVTMGMGRAAAAGLLIRNSEVLQSSSSLTTLVVDKTGTLTEGRPAVKAVETLNDQEQRFAASLAGMSDHPLSRAIVEFVPGDRLPVTDFESHAGGGLSATVDGHHVLLGSRQFIETRLRTLLPDVSHPGSEVFVSVDGNPQGYFLLEDAVRDEAIEAVAILQAGGIDVVMLTGDRAETATRVAEQLGISNWKAGLLPDEKLQEIRRLQATGKVVGMAGDGINDAAALAAANVGFAMGGGTDVAMETADVTLLHDELAGIWKTITLSRRTVSNIYQNLFAASVYNLLLIPVAAGVLYPLTGMLIDPALAGLAMAASSISVVANASRLRLS